MKIYLVGGAVRDKLLGLPIQERDWVVVGASANDMLALGYRSVGKDFPVFLHPETKEEYALARTERKIKPGYTGFQFDTSLNVTLEEDLQRRDLTINAMAETEEGQLIDPFQGKKDLDNKILRHVSQAFVEDPVRILRVARFAARFPDFQVAPETNELMKKMVVSGEVDALVPERVWKELERALKEKSPERFFQVLAACDALSKLFPVFSNLQGLERAASLSTDPEVRFASLFKNVEEASVRQLCERYRIPNNYKELALLVSRYRHSFQKINYSTLDYNQAEEIIDLLKSIDAFRRPDRAKKFILICYAMDSDFPSEKWKRYFKVIDYKVDSKSIVTQSLGDLKSGSPLTGQEYGAAIKKLLIKGLIEIDNSQDLP